MNLPFACPINLPLCRFQTEISVKADKLHFPLFRMAVRVVLMCALLVGAILKPVAAQQRNDQDQRGRIRSEVSLVGLLASVLDKDGRPALNLTADQFEVYEEGVKQEIELFEPETQQPLDLALMIDSSLSEIKDLEFESEAASRFIQKVVRPGDRLALYEFADAVTLIEPFSSECAAAASRAEAHRSRRWHGNL